MKWLTFAVQLDTYAFTLTFFSCKKPYILAQLMKVFFFSSVMLCRSFAFRLNYHLFKSSKFAETLHNNIPLFYKLLWMLKHSRI